MTLMKKLVMKGFKSFANKTELVFGDQFNCILGPNGSGKSNVLDAICFVLGKGSSKSLRAEKSANLIYNGGKKKNPMKEGMVEIFFDNKKKDFPSDEPIVKISRIIKSNGQSIYKINDKTRTRNQVLDFLAAAKINPDGYNIILQGDIVKLVEMTPRERMKIVEEIAGIGIYEEKKQKAVKELENVENRLNEANIILTERKTYLAELKKERDQALKYKELRDKINENKASYLFHQIKKKEAEEARFEKRNKKHKDKIDEIQKEINTLRELISKKKEEISEINKQIEEKGEKEQVALHKEVESLKVRLGTNKARVDSLKNELAKLAERKKQLVQNKEEIANKIKILEKEKQEYIAEKEKGEKEIASFEKRIKEFKEKNRIGSAADIEKEIEEADQKAEKIQEEIQELRHEQQELLREKDRLEFQIKTTDEKISKVLEIEKEHKAEILKLKKKKEDFKKITLDLNKALNEDSSLASQLGNARPKLLKVQEEITKLKAHNMGVKEQISGSLAVQKIISNKKKFPGVFGQVHELGTVSSKYATALEVAAGPRIKSIVVDNDKTAAECIKYLKANKLGTATFLPLNKLRPPVIDEKTKKLAKANGVEGLALDLIKFDPKLKKAFQYVFGSTLIVDSIDVARRLGIGEIRAATLDGDLVEKSGAMIGGYRKKLPFGFQQSEVMADITKKEQEEEDLQKLINVLEKRRSDNEKKIQSLREKKAELEGEIIKAEKSLHLDSSDLSVNKKLKEELKKDLAEVEKKLSSLQTKISSSNSELAKIKIEKQKLKEKVSQLRNPVLLAELNTFEQKKQEIRESIIKYDAEIKNITAQIDSMLKPEIENTDKIIKQHEKEEEEFLKEEESLKAQIERDEKDLREKEEKEKTFMSKFKSLFSQRNKANDELQKAENKIILKEEEIRGIEQKTNSISLEEAKVKAELSALREEFKQFDGVPINKEKTEEQLKREIWDFERMAEKLGAINMKALEIYEVVEKEYKALLDKKEKLLVEKEDVIVMMNEIETKKKDIFMKTFRHLEENFKKIFSQLTTKGEALLKLENPENPFEGGLEIQVRLTGKKFIDMRSLSGGEKTLTALAFLFAVQEFEPASFYILDEVDAALDKRNSEKLASLIRSYSNKAQYLIISHNDSVISEADNLYGVSMNEDGISKTVSLKI
ncbi:chromosome segregation protein SMC [Candidatus Woesearchaeota archaeon]|nr:MAG: chromosome segregation protein SMC [Candidatus Woesearchaeota archaeon]